jgi:predicted restriction endonuclease
MTPQQAKEMTLEQHLRRESIKDKHPSWKSAHIRNFNRSWNKDLLNLSCQVCGYKHHIELAHIKPISSFSEQDKLGVINDSSNILVLCPNHHWEFDNNVLLLTDIPIR